MNRKCQSCKLVARRETPECPRCGGVLADRNPHRGRILRRILVCISVCVTLILGFYLSLIGSARSLTYDQKQIVRSAIKVVRDRGFSDEARLLESFTAYRSTDNWLNEMVAKENAYAATNFPFEIMTLYADFFAYPVDDTERAAILLHEARHLMGEDERQAYSYVWKNRTKLGWTREAYADSTVWESVREQTRETVPELFVCPANDFEDCTEVTRLRLP